MAERVYNLADYIKNIGPNLIRTPSELFSLPVRTVLRSGRAGGLRSYNCFFQLGEVMVDLDATRLTAAKDDLIILYRGAPTRVEYHPQPGVHAVGLNPELIVTVLGVSPDNRNKKRKYSAHWAFVDSTSGWKV